MPRHLLPASLRAQLALAIAVVTTAGIGVSFLALYSGTTARLRAQIDGQLHTQAAEWHGFVTHADLSTPARLEQTARHFIASQAYHAESLVMAIQLPNGRVVSNDPEVIARQEARDRSSPGPGLLNAPPGLSTANVAEAGSMRILTRPIIYGDRVIGTLRVANPLRPVTQAQASLRRTFAIVGSVALGVAVLLGLVLAGVIAAPLRRMARAAETVEAGDLSVRVGSPGPRSKSEVQTLARAFDHMLDRLERLFSRQREFVSDASHELRTPLTVLRAQVELIEGERDEERRHEATMLLLRRIDELNRIVSDLLTLASVEAGQLVEPEEIELSDFFEDLRRDLPLFGERDFSVDATPGMLHADPDRLTQVLRNLVRNAVAHTAPGDAIQITAEPSADHLEIAVRDSGPGIPADQLEHIFERFRRLPGAGSRDAGGSGLGLAIARAIVEAHGGRIWAESAAGQGAVFRVDLPGYRRSGRSGPGGSERTGHDPPERPVVGHRSGSGGDPGKMHR